LRAAGYGIPAAGRHGLTALRHDLLKFLTLGWSQRVPHVQAIINGGFFHRQLDYADFLQLGIDRGPVRLVGSEKVVQIHPLDLKIGPIADLCLAEGGFLLTDLLRLVGGDAELLTDTRIAQKPPELRPLLSHTQAAPTHPAPLASPRTTRPHATAPPQPVARRSVVKLAAATAEPIWILC